MKIIFSNQSDGNISDFELTPDATFSELQLHVNQAYEKAGRIPYPFLIKFEKFTNLSISSEESGNANLYDYLKHHINGNEENIVVQVSAKSHKNEIAKEDIHVGDKIDFRDAKIGGNISIKSTADLTLVLNKELLKQKTLTVNNSPQPEKKPQPKVVEKNINGKRFIASTVTGTAIVKDKVYIKHLGRNFSATDIQDSPMEDYASSSSFNPKFAFSAKKMTVGYVGDLYVTESQGHKRGKSQ